MVRILLVIMGFLTHITITKACGGYYQCKNSNGSHCCVMPAKHYTPLSCPSDCTGGTAWPAECIGTLDGSKRHQCYAV